MQAAQRNVVDCLYPVIQKKTLLSFVQRPSISSTVQSGFRHVRGDKPIAFPILSQKRYRVTTKRKPTVISSRTRKFGSINEFIDFIRHVLDLVGREELWRKSEFPEFSRKLNEELLTRKRKADVPVFTTLREAWNDQREEGLKMQIKYLFYGNMANRTITKSDITDQKKLVDLRFPANWYPATREMQRSIHLHVGPTNSGKTYHALKRLEKAKTGIYAGPLRLLAHEVYSRLNAQGISCHLVTGDERIIKEEVSTAMASCTVEMVPLNHEVDVAIIDEIQMIGNQERGWAWSQSLFGVKAKELHLCGETRTVPLIRELATLMGDKLEIHHYERLSPLETMPSSLKGSYNNIKKGDCMVVFSKKKIQLTKIIIEKTTKKRVAIIYGDLPPETRAQQARLFNDPDNDYDFLVATDAIGMGLNLSIKRIIFESSMKNNGDQLVTIEDHSIKQIGGRAGRYRAGVQIKDGSSQVKDHDAAPKDVGLVTSFYNFDLKTITRAMRSEPTPVLTAGLFPTSEIVTRFAAYFPLGTPFSYILLRIDELSLMHPRFHKCNLRDQARVADIIEPVKDLTIRDRLIFCAAPVPKTADGHKICKVFAQCAAENGGGGLLEIEELNLGILDEQSDGSPEFQVQLESLHRSLTLYLWLGFRFPGVFRSQKMAEHVKRLVQERIEQHLSNASVLSKGKIPQKLQARHQQAKTRHIKQVVDAGATVNGDPPNVGDDISNTRRDAALPPDKKVAQSTQQLVDNMALKYIPKEVSETGGLEAAA